MSRIANSPVELPSGVEVNMAGQIVSVKGKNGEMSCDLTSKVIMDIDDNILNFKAKSEDRLVVALAGTIRSLVNNMVIGVTTGFQKKLELRGVGYRSQVKGNVLNLSLGFSHPVEHQIPKGITVETPSQTEIIVKGCDKQLVGQVAADIRAYRPPEPYKGKGVRYANEHVVMKEAKKK